MKRSFALLLTIFLVALFSLLLIQLYFTQNLTSNEQSKEYWHAQSLFHLKFFKSLILDSKNQKCTDSLTLEMPSFKLYAHIDCAKEPAVVDAFVKVKDDSFSI
ncbi:MAG: hypothetical protein WC141_05270, partial [Arcobacteraceae bacterium]